MNISVKERLGAPPEVKGFHNQSIAGTAKVILAAIFAGLIYYGMFQLPFRFPPRERLWSASYAFGFNNTVAILALAILLATAAMLYLIRPYARGVPELRFQIRIKPERGNDYSFLIALIGAVTLYIVLTFAMYSYYVGSAPPLMWEVRHLLYRTFLINIYGLRPYIDFQAEYGPLLTYTPLCIYWLLKPVGASLEQAYFLAHLLLNVGGLGCAYYLLSRAVMPANARTISFGVLAIAGFAPYMGLSGVLLRYLCPFASLLAGHLAVAGMLSRPKGRANFLRLTIIILLLLIANILLSSEAGAAFAIAWLGYGVLMLRRDTTILTVSLIAFVLVGFLCCFTLPSPYYGSLFSFSKGANNLPLVPVPHLLLYVLTLFLLVPRLLGRSLRSSTDADVTDAAISGAFGGLCALMALGALGRCDLPHVLFYGMGASLLLMIWLANFSRVAFAGYTMAYATVFIGLMQLVNLQVFYGVPAGSFRTQHGFADALRTVRHTVGTERLDNAKLAALDRYPRLGLPFASFEDPLVERYLLSRKQAEPDYYTSIVGVYTHAAVERKLRDLAKSEYLLVPSRFATLLPRNPCAEYRKNMKEWFLYSANLACRADVLDPFGDVNRFVAEHYVPVEEVGSWTVLRRAGTASN